MADASVTKPLGLQVSFDPGDSQLRDGFSASSLFLVGGTNALNKPLEYLPGRNLMWRFLKSGAEVSPEYGDVSHCFILEHNPTVLLWSEWRFWGELFLGAISRELS